MFPTCPHHPEATSDCRKPHNPIPMAQALVPQETGLHPGFTAG